MMITQGSPVSYFLLIDEDWSTVDVLEGMSVEITSETVGDRNVSAGHLNPAVGMEQAVTAALGCASECHDSRQATSPRIGAAVVRSIFRPVVVHQRGERCHVPILVHRGKGMRQSDDPTVVSVDLRRSGCDRWAHAQFADDSQVRFIGRGPSRPASRRIHVNQARFLPHPVPTAPFAEEVQADGAGDGNKLHHVFLYGQRSGPSHEVTRRSSVDAARLMRRAIKLPLASSKSPDAQK